MAGGDRPEPPKMEEPPELTLDVIRHSSRSSREGGPAPCGASVRRLGPGSKQGRKDDVGDEMEVPTSRAVRTSEMEAVSSVQRAGNIGWGLSYWPKKFVGCVVVFVGPINLGSVLGALLELIFWSETLYLAMGAQVGNLLELLQGLVKFFFCAPWSTCSHHPQH